MNEELRATIRQQALAAQAAGRKLEIAPDLALRCLDWLVEAVERHQQLQAQLDGLNLAATQYSESRDHWFPAARQAEAEAALLRAALTEIESWCQSLIDGTDIIDPAWVVQRASLVRDLDAGAALLAELEAGRALADRLLKQLNLIGSCPVCSARMDPFVGVFQHADGCQLAIYEAARKARR